MRTSRHDGGSISPVFLVIAGICLWALALVALLGRELAADARADAAAEAVALAAAAGADPAAIAEANSASLLRISTRRASGEVEIEVEIEGGATGRAAARPAYGSPGSPGPGPGGNSSWLAAAGASGRRQGLSPAMLAALERADMLLAARGLGGPVPVASGYRSYEQQMALWAARAANPYPVAPPGRSAHQRGTAVDVPRAFVPVLLEVAAEAGLCRPIPESDPVHFELGGGVGCGGQGPPGRAVLTTAAGR